MKSSAPRLGPLLRTDAQGRLLAWLALHPEREFSITELGGLAAVSVPTALHEVDRLVDLGVARDRRVGRTRLVAYDDTHPVARPLREVLAYGYGPAAVLPDLLRRLPGLDGAYIYGSWAARNAGERGSDPNDVDVLVIGDVDRVALDDVATEASRIVGREVNMNMISTARWREGTDGFVRTVRERPLVPLIEVTR